MSLGAFFQPWKYITVIMEDATNGGMTTAASAAFVQVNGVQVNILTSDKRYQPVVIQSDGTGAIAAADGVACVGVLTESFSRPMIPTQVCASGIIPVVALAAITPGQQLMAGAGGVKPYVAGSSNTLLGVAVTGASAAGEYVSILLSI